MSDHISKTITDLEGKLKQQLEEVARTKRMINDLSGLAGLAPRYADAVAESAPSLTALRSDQFYGRPLATVVREYLEMRKAGNLGAATVNEIYDALVSGGFKFETSNDDNAKRGLRISLAKNTAVFHKLPNGGWGLLEWYPAAKNRPARGEGGAAGKNGDDDGDVEEEEADQQAGNRAS